MQQQFPYLRTTQDEEIIEHAKEINRILSFFLIYGFWYVLKLQKEKADLAQLYPRLQEWKEYYTRPANPDEVTDKERNHLVHPYDEEWEKHKQEENKNTNKKKTPSCSRYTSRKKHSGSSSMI